MEESSPPQISPFVFRPIDNDTQKVMAKRIGHIKPVANFYEGAESVFFLEHRFPERKEDTKGDGACLPRTISLAVTIQKKSIAAETMK